MRSAIGIGIVILSTLCSTIPAEVALDPTCRQSLVTHLSVKTYRLIDPLKVEIPPEPPHKLTNLVDWINWKISCEKGAQFACRFLSDYQVTPNIFQYASYRLIKWYPKP